MPYQSPEAMDVGGGGRGCRVDGEYVFERRTTPEPLRVQHDRESFSTLVLGPKVKVSAIK